jgi:hypothetical protein
VGQRISEVRFASYGLPTSDCGNGLSATSCHASNSLAVLAEKCVGQQSCTVAASNADFGDPCPDTVKRLSARVLCDTQPLPPSSCGTLEAGEGLFPNQELRSCDGRFGWRLSSSGDLSLSQRYDLPEGGILNETIYGAYAQTAPGGRVVMQLDGNLVYYEFSGDALWSSNTAGFPNATLRVQDDGNLVIYDVSGVALWASNTCCR